MHYKIKSGVSLFEKRETSSKYKVEFLFSTTRKVSLFELNKKTLEVIKSFGSAVSLENIEDRFDISRDELIELVTALVSEGILEEISSASDTFSEPIYRRELNFFAAYETRLSPRATYLNKLKDAKVLILGLGGIGSWVAASLARSGVGKLILVDPDVVTISNISHQSVYNLSHLGECKTDIIARECSKTNTDIQTVQVVQKIRSPKDLHSHMSETDIIINCADSPSTDKTNELVSRVGFRYQVPHILCGGYDGHESSIGQTVIPGKTSCWFCYLESGIFENLSRGFKHVPLTTSQIEGGTLAPIAAISGNIQALEGIRLITGYEKPHMLNRKGEFNFSSYTLSTQKIPRYKKCSLCGTKKG